MQKFRGRPMLRIRHRIPSFVIPFILTAALSLGLFRYVSVQLSPIIETIAENNVKNLISLSAASAVNDCLSAGQFTYQSFVDTATHADGRIVSLSLRPSESAQFKNAVIDFEFNCVVFIYGHAWIGVCNEVQFKVKTFGNSCVI